MSLVATIKSHFEAENISFVYCSKNWSIGIFWPFKCKFRLKTFTKITPFITRSMYLEGICRCLLPPNPMPAKVEHQEGIGRFPLNTFQIIERWSYMMGNGYSLHYNFLFVDMLGPPKQPMGVFRYQSEFMSKGVKQVFT